MKYKTTVIILLAVICISAVSTAGWALSAKAHNFKYEYGVFIGCEPNQTSRFAEHHTIVIDAAYYTKAEIEALHNKGHIVYSYLNIGSIENFRDYFKDYKHLTLSKYENWPEEFWIDVSSAKWQIFVVDELATQLAEKAIDGFFIDNADVYYNFKTKAIYEGLVKIFTGLAKFKLKVIVNGGDVFISEYIEKNKTITNIISGVNQESVYTSIDFENKCFYTADASSTEYYINYLKNVQRSGCEVYLLEYTTDKKLEKKIAASCQLNRWNYYIASSLELN